VRKESLHSRRGELFAAFFHTSLPSVFCFGEKKEPVFSTAGTVPGDLLPDVRPNDPLTQAQTHRR
jgi:hypothetical protein